jgi:hypothetical protein
MERYMNEGQKTSDKFSITYDDDSPINVKRIVYLFFQKLLVVNINEEKTE